MTENEMKPYLNRIGAMFGFGLPEHEQRRRLRELLAEVYALGQQDPIKKTNQNGVTVRKVKRK
jgi:hypothetical protein